VSPRCPTKTLVVCLEAVLYCTIIVGSTGDGARSLERHGDGDSAKVFESRKGPVKSASARALAAAARWRQWLGYRLALAHCWLMRFIRAYYECERTGSQCR
jgi:hypothetical protein